MQTGRRRGPEPLVAQETRYLHVVAYAPKNVGALQWLQPEVEYVGVRWLPLFFLLAT